MRRGTGRSAPEIPGWRNCSFSQQHRLLLTLAEAIHHGHERTLLRTTETTVDFTAHTIEFLNRKLAPCIGRHGVLMDVYGEGVMLTGDSGIGKSETAIELIMAARGVIRDVGRVMGLPYAEVDAIAKQVPNTQHITLSDALRLSKPLSDLYEGDENVKTLIDTARKLEGMPRNASTHAAGVVITKKPVYEYVPLAKNDDAVVCQYIMTTLEELGLLKMDFLGLRNLTVLDDAVKMVQAERPGFRLEDIPEDDAPTYEMLGQGKTIGVFQMESTGMTGVCVGLKPRSMLLIMGTFLLTYTTSPIRLTDGLEQLMGGLKKLRVPVHELAMMMSIALRFIPTLIEETDKIMSAQKARGADFESGNLFHKAKALIPILVPLFISAFRRADELAVAMECRCYHGGEGRTKLNPLKYAARDYWALACGAVITAGVIVLGRFGF